MKKILNKKVLGVLLAVMMLFSLSAPAFATGTTATVKVYVPEYVIDDYAFDYVYTGVDSATGYVYAGDGEDILGDPVSYYSYTSSPITISSITGWTVTPPTGFQGIYNNNPNLPYLPTVFDVIYKAMVNGRGETPHVYNPNGANNSGFVYDFKMPIYNSLGGREDYIYLYTISDVAEHVNYEYHPTAAEIAAAGEPIPSIWYGYVHHIYCVPDTVTDFDPLAPDSTYLADYYGNNILAGVDYTYYLIYELDYQEWYE